MKINKIILSPLFIPSILCAADFPHNTNPYLLKEYNRGRLYSKQSEDSTYDKLRKAERYRYYRIPTSTRPSWREYLSYPNRVKVED